MSCTQSLGLTLTFFGAVLLIILSASVDGQLNPRPIIFNFGDSNSDTGGLVAGLGFSVNPPYGRTFFRRSTGRLCSIKFNGPSSVSQYFKPKSTGIESEGLRTQEAYFRGRKLQGASIPIPDGYSGFVLGKKSLGKRKASDNSDGSSNCWEMNAKYKSITYWNHDSLPSQDDAFLRCFHWLSVAKSMHEPATPGDLVSASAALEKMN